MGRAYDVLYRHVILRMDAELAHDLGHLAIRSMSAVAGRLLRRGSAPVPGLATTVMGIDFPSPVGMAAGFDKNARSVIGLADLGFGHVEIGTVTAKAQPGNPKPRLFRLPADRAFINRMGFNNRGAAAAARVLEKLRRHPRRPVIGVNIGKTKVVPVEEAVADYRESARLLAPLADYLVVNVSSPNTPGLRGLQDAELLEPLLTAVLAEAGGTPLLVKIAPDLADEDVAAIVDLAVRVGLAGIIATNTTIRRDGLASPASLTAEVGGLSGAPVAARAVEVLRIIRATAPASFAVISVGGIDDAADVRARLNAGADLVQAYTAFIYRGPFWARGILRGLAAR